MGTPVGARTLAEVRKAVAQRCNFGSQPQKIKQVQPILDQYIGDSHMLLASMCDWLAAYRHVDTQLSNAQPEYDFPDDCLPGNIFQMVVVDTNGNEQPVFAGMRPNERNAANPITGQPLRYEIYDGVIKLWPGPDTSSWTILRLYYQATPVSPMDDTATIVVDFNALVRHATRSCKLHWKMAAESKEELDEFVELMVAAQSDGEVFHFGGRTSFKTDHRKQNRISRTGSPTTSTGPDWNPPGF